MNEWYWDIWGSKAGSTSQRRPCPAARTFLTRYFTGRIPPPIPQTLSSRTRPCFMLRSVLACCRVCLLGTREAEWGALGIPTGQLTWRAHSLSLPGSTAHTWEASSRLPPYVPGNCPGPVQRSGVTFWGTPTPSATCPFGLFFYVLQSFGTASWTVSSAPPQPRQ